MNQLYKRACFWRLGARATRILGVRHRAGDMDNEDVVPPVLFRIELRRDFSVTSTIRSGIMVISDSSISMPAVVMASETARKSVGSVMPSKGSPSVLYVGIPHGAGWRNTSHKTRKEAHYMSDSQLVTPPTMIEINDEYVFAQFGGKELSAMHDDSHYDELKEALTPHYETLQAMQSNNSSWFS